MLVYAVIGAASWGEFSPFMEKFHWDSILTHLTLEDLRDHPICRWPVILVVCASVFVFVMELLL